MVLVAERCIEAGAIEILADDITLGLKAQMHHTARKQWVESIDYRASLLRSDQTS